MARQIRMGIDVGGTHTKAVAIDNTNHEIIGKSSVKTTHDDKFGVAAGVVKAFQNCMAENNIKPEDVIFVAHSTTQATNALIEGDVAKVGIIGVANGGLESLLAKRQLKLSDINLGTGIGRVIKIYNKFIKRTQLTNKIIHQNVEQLKEQGANVIVASMAFGVDGLEDEKKYTMWRKEWDFRLLWLLILRNCMA
jgi:N-methylhydantoinase A